MPAMTASQLRDAVGDLFNARGEEQGRLHRIRRHLADSVTGRHAGVFVPRRATREYTMLVEQSRFNILDLVVTAKAQGLYVDGYRPSVNGRVTSSENSAVWDVWQANRMDARQSAIYRSALSYGAGYAMVLPGEPVPAITPVSPFEMTALYVDPHNDEWPEVAMHYLRPTKRAGRRIERVEVFDDTNVYQMIRDSGKTELVATLEHGLGVVPVVRFLDRYDLAGSVGKVEPLIALQQQINQTTFSLLMTQQHQAFRQRHVTGMEIQEDENGNLINPFQAGADSVWQAESPDTKFGEFSEVSLSGYLESRDKAILHAASMSQTPPHNLLIGNGISNISAETLAALEAGHRQDIAEHQTSFGESVEQMLRLAGLADPSDDETWSDLSAQVVWAGYDSSVVGSGR